jgi:hypothetical protein
MIKKNVSLLLAGVLALSGCSASHSRIKTADKSEGEIVEAEGTAPYKADDLPGSKAASLAAAQRSAVELVVGVYVNAKTRVDKAVAIENTILSQTAGYIKKYEILSEGVSGEWYKTRIRALVSTQALHDKLSDMGLLRLPVLSHPRVAVLLQEYVGEKEDTNGAATRALTQQLLNQGFKVVDLPQSVNRAEDPLEIARGLSHSAAELVLAGLARAQSMGDKRTLGGMSSYRASLTFRVIETGTGEVVTTVSQVASGLEGTPEIASQKAFEKAAELTHDDLAALPQLLTDRAHASVTITGLKSFEILSDFEKNLLKEHGVKDIYLRSFNQNSGIANLDVLLDQISPQELGDRCVKVGGAEWSVYQVSGRSVDISASQAGR